MSNNNTTSLARWELVKSMAPQAYEARLFKGISSAAQAAMIMEKGCELGFEPLASFDFISIILNKPCLSPRGALALIYRSGELTNLTIREEKDACTVSMSRSNGVSYTTSWTLEDARKADLVKKESGWEKYPSNMLRWRCIGWAADVVFPDVIGGLKRSDELGATIDDQGDVIEGESHTVTPEPPKMTLNSLVGRYGAEKVFRLNGGVIPSTQEEIDNLADAIEAGEAASEQD